MDNNWITVKKLINKVSFELILIDTDCEYYYIVNKDLITELQLPRV